MEKSDLIKTFCWKIGAELKLYKYRILQKSKEEILAFAYEIDCMITIYEILLEMSQKMELEILKSCIQIPELLTFLYQEWLKIPDERNREIEENLWFLVQSIRPQAA